MIPAPFKTSHLKLNSRPVDSSRKCKLVLATNTKLTGSKVISNGTNPNFNQTQWVAKLKISIPNPEKRLPKTNTESKVVNP